MPPVMAIKTDPGTHHLSIGLEAPLQMHERLTLKVNPDRFIKSVSFCFGFVKDLKFLPAFRTHRSSVVMVEPTYFRIGTADLAYVTLF
jgi:hypothetical protein